MLVSATVRVRFDKAEASPERARVEQAARLLEQLGFEILRIGRFGVNVRAQDSTFHRILGVKPAPNQALAAPVSSTNPALRELVDLVEVAPKPQLY